MILKYALLALFFLCLIQKRKLTWKKGSELIPYTFQTVDNSYVIIKIIIRMSTRNKKKNVECRLCLRERRVFLEPPKTNFYNSFFVITMELQEYVQSIHMYSFYQSHNFCSLHFDRLMLCCYIAQLWRLFVNPLFIVVEALNERKAVKYF